LFSLTISPPPRSTLFPYTTLFRSDNRNEDGYHTEFKRNRKPASEQIVHCIVWLFDRRAEIKCNDCLFLLYISNRIRLVEIILFFVILSHGLVHVLILVVISGAGHADHRSGRLSKD